MLYNGVAFPVKLEWKEIKGFEGYYEVSNHGQVRSMTRNITFERRGKLQSRIFIGKVLSPKTDKDGYKEVCLRKDGESVHRRVHRLVGGAFLSGNGEGFVIDHKDGVKDNNHYYNLQWMTNTENTIKYYSQEAELHRPLSSLSRYEWLYIGYLYNNGMDYKAIVENLGLGIKSHDTLWEGLSGRRLSSVTGFKKGDFIKRKHPLTKLDPETVAYIIKERLVDKKPLKVLSGKYNIAESMISRFCKGTRQPEGLQIFKEKYKTGDFN